MTRFTGDIDDYTSRIAASPTEVTSGATADSSASRKLQRQERARQREAERGLRQQLSEVEKRLSQHTTTLTELEAQLADSDIYHTLPAEELDALLARAGRYRQRVEQAEERWLELTDELEKMRDGAG